MSVTTPATTGARPDRGRAPSIATLALLAALAWAAVILWTRAAAMADAMPGRATAAGALLFAGMWLVMMAAMMLPAVTPMVVLFRTLQRQRGQRGSPVVSSAAFVAGYLAVWTLSGVAADLAYMAARNLGTRMQAGAGAVPIAGGTLIVLAGLYQFSPLKHVCLTRCRSPFQIILHGWHEGRLGALRMGASHGTYCLGCCWGIMAVLFVVGLMNLAWMAALCLLIVAEKLAPRGAIVGRLVGVLFIVLGVFMAVQPRLFPPSGLRPGHGMTMSGMAPAAAPMGTFRYRALAGPYALTLIAYRPSRSARNLATSASAASARAASSSARAASSAARVASSSAASASESSRRPHGSRTRSHVPASSFSTKNSKPPSALLRN